MINEERLLQEVLALRRRLAEIAVYCEQLPGGIDADANPLDTNPENVTAHIGGLIWRLCQWKAGNTR